MNICFVSEHGPAIGDGHISRQYAIAEWLIENDIAVDLYTNDLSNFFVEKFKKIGARTFEIEIEPTLIANRFNSERAYQWCFIDGDQIADATELAIKKSLGCKTIRVSDLPINYRHSDVLINQNFASDHLEYESVSGQKRYFGLKHVILRKMIREFAAGAPDDKNKKITISLGNSVSDKSRALVEALIQFFSNNAFDDFSIEIFTNNNIADAASPGRQKNITIRTPSDEFIVSIKCSEFVICSVGTTMWECMALGIPYSAIPLNDPQARYVETLENARICMTLAPDDVLQGGDEMTNVIDHYRDRNAQIAYKMLYKKLMPDRYFAALEETLS